MKIHKQWLTSGLALSITGLLAGCSAAGHGTTIARNGTVNAISASNNSTMNATTTYKTYTNQRFGFSFEYPSTWQMGPRPNDGDGRWFTTSSGDKSFDNGYGSGLSKSDVMLQGVGTVNTVFGSGNGYDFKQMVAAFKKNLASERKQQGFVSESCTVVPNKWIVDTLVTKVGDGGIRYSKTYTSLSTNQTILMIFPVNKSEAYFPIWNYVSQKFQV